MDLDTLRLEAPGTASAPPLRLRPWHPADAGELAGLRGDDALRRWTSLSVDDEAGAARWVREQRDGARTGTRFAFAVVESRPTGGRLAGHVVLKRPGPGSASAEVGYWTAAHARGRGVAPRALDTLTDWAFAAFAADGLTRLELLHQVGNTASCRVAEKSRYAFTALLPAAPPGFPLDGHRHVRVAGAGRGARVR